MEKSPTNEIMLLGLTGTGKSETANTLAGQPNLFASSAAAEVFNNQTTYHTVPWFNEPNANKYTIIDTPGLGENSEQDIIHLNEVIGILKEKITSLRTFILVINGAFPSLGKQFHHMVQLYTKIFGEKMWDQLIVVVTNWCFDEKSKRNRKVGNTSEESQSSEIYCALTSALDIEVQIPMVFIDNFDAREEDREPELVGYFSQLKDFIDKCPQFDLSDINCKALMYEMAKNGVETFLEEKLEQKKEFEAKNEENEEKMICEESIVAQEKGIYFTNMKRITYSIELLDSTEKKEE